MQHMAKASGTSGPAPPTNARTSSINSLMISSATRQLSNFDVTMTGRTGDGGVHGISVQLSGSHGCQSPPKLAGFDLGSTGALSWLTTSFVSFSQYATLVCCPSGRKRRRKHYQVGQQNAQRANQEHRRERCADIRPPEVVSRSSG